MLLPYSLDLLVKLLVELESVSIRKDNTFERLWISNWLNDLLIITNEVVVKYKSSWLLLLLHDISNLKEEIRNFRVLVVELFSSLGAARALVSLQNDQEIFDESLSFGNKSLLVEMD